MAYASGRELFDADSHLLELPDFFDRYGDPEVRDRLPGMAFYADQGPKLQHVLDKIMGGGRRHDDLHRSKMRDLGDAILTGPKGYRALGAFDGDDRTMALDQLGFQRQLLFATFSAVVVFEMADPELAYGGARAHNRGVAEFCGDDDRLIGVGCLPMHDIDRSLVELDFALANGLGAIWVPTTTWAGTSPGHGAWDRFWARLADAQVPFALHVGGHPRNLAPGWTNNGLALPKGFEEGGGEHVHAREMAALHHAAEIFLTSCIFDGVFERHRQLRGLCVELGAGWVPQLLDRLDWVVDIWARNDDALQALSAKPSEIAAQHLGFTPYVYEDVGKLIDQSSADLYLFSTDYPHAEGGRDPLGRFDRSLASAGIDQPSQNKFFAENFRRVLVDT
ncbi:MAG: amidohydrolase family protein [Acidimicrobiales bacterium]